MRALLVDAPRAAARRPLRMAEVADPRPAAGEVAIEVSACGVCRTDLHIVEGDLAAPAYPVIPGHQVVGRVTEPGAGVTHLRVGDRVGVAWLGRTCGTCAFCASGAENLCEASRFTGYHAQGGFAERLSAPADFVYPLPDLLGEDTAAAPLLCAGIIGYRALKRSRLEPGGTVALYGFGASAHLALQVALAWGAHVYVISRSPAAAARAIDSGAAWAGAPGEALPSPVDAAVSFAPAGAVIPGALRSLRKGGTLALAGIYIDSVPELDYTRELFDERTLTSVTANTREDGREFLDLAARERFRVDSEVAPWTEANDVLRRLKEDALVAQCAVLRVAGS